MLLIDRDCRSLARSKLAALFVREPPTLPLDEHFLSDSWIEVRIVDKPKLLASPDHPVGHPRDLHCLTIFTE